MRIDQVMPSMVAGDAISAHAVQIQRLLADAGRAGTIYVAQPGAELPAGAEVTAAEELGIRPAADATLYHLSVGSDLSDRFAGLGGRKAVVYHNVTPPRFFEGWDPPMADVMRAGRKDLRHLAPVCVLGIGDSEFNRLELQRAGFERTGVLPILIDQAALQIDGDRRLGDELAQRRSRGRIWLFVGRFAPNKCQHEIVEAFAAYRRHADPHSTLVLIGTAFTGSYRAAVLALAERLGVADGVVARGPVTQPELVACYRAADVLVCLSEHEGFCVPVVEAMSLGVPVVAYSATAVPETAGEGALLLDDKDPVFVGAVVAELLDDEATRADLIERGHHRAESLSAHSARATLEGLIGELVG